jgi:DNA-binding NarL/FixJ family response regulator
VEGNGVSIGVVIADDQALVRSAVATLIDGEPDMTVLGEACDGQHAVDLARCNRPEVVLMDVRMPRLDGIAATRQVTSDPDCAGTRIVILTTFDLDEYVFGAIRAGASGFLLKDTPASEVLNAIRVVAGGDALLTPAATRRLIAEYAERPRPANTPRRDLGALTERETDILLLIARGLSNDEICRHLHITMATTKSHIGRLRAKLLARDRAQLVITAYEAGLV